MQTTTILYIILAGVAALLLAGFQYYNNKKSRTKLNLLFLFLRFLSLFSVLLLLINPKFEQVVLSNEKPNLVVAVDNSESMAFLKQSENVTNFVNALKSNTALQNKFNLQFYTFGNSLKTTDSLTFSEKETNISRAFGQLGQVYKNTTAPTVVITDGNQTYGNDYAFGTSAYNQPIFPVIMGDTTQYSDLTIKQLNVNKYAFLKNKFPVEAILLYSGNAPVASQLTVYQGTTKVHTEAVNFTKTDNSKIIHFTLPANRVGVQVYKAVLTPLASEKNTVNNAKNFAVEVVNQQTKVAIVSHMLHPDMGALKKSIESNEQRSVQFLKPNEILNQINDFQLVVLYQPDSSFKEIYDFLNAENRNRFTIIGTKTDLSVVNANSNFDVENTNQTEKYQARINRDFSPFIIDNIGFESFPPLTSPYGSTVFKTPFETLLQKTYNGVETNEPLLATTENNQTREAVLFGENLWQWRAQSFLNSKSFNAFDDFMGKLVQYLASNTLKSRLNVSYQSFYNGNSNVLVNAEFFDKNYVFDARETLNITVKDSVSKQSKTFPFILKNNTYQVDLSSLPPSEYTFTVSASNENISKSGRFTILDYNVEQQFLNANAEKLGQLAANSQGKAFYTNNVSALETALLNDDRFATVQKSHKNTLPLVDWKYLLGIIVLSLAVEWFLRKYNGLI
ncbi:MAG: VWA domain-containing protein [Flavobacteriaceae bacterium]